MLTNRWEKIGVRQREKGEKRRRLAGRWGKLSKLGKQGRQVCTYRAKQRSVKRSRPDYHEREKGKAGNENKQGRVKRQRQGVFFRRVLRLISYLGMTGGGLAVLYFLLTKGLMVKEVECSINQGVSECPAGIKQNLEYLFDKPMFFYNFKEELEGWRTDEFNFAVVSYAKELPGTVKINFTFLEPTFKLTGKNQESYFFDVFGRHTMIFGAREILEVEVRNEQLWEKIASFQLETLLEQKLYNLLYLSEGRRENWLRVIIYDIEYVEIQTRKATYLVDFLAVDENLQKLDFIERSDFKSEAEDPVVDLRLNWPVVKNESGEATGESAIEGGIGVAGTGR
jgi:hypothetical protein